MYQVIIFVKILALALFSFCFYIYWLNPRLGYFLIIFFSSIPPQENQIHLYRGKIFPSLYLWMVSLSLKLNLQTLIK